MTSKLNILSTDFFNRKQLWEQVQFFFSTARSGHVPSATAYIYSFILDRASLTFPFSPNIPVDNIL